MCERLGQLREAMGRYAVGFDAALLSCDDARAVVLAAAIENLAATVKGLAAAHLARVTGTSLCEVAGFGPVAASAVRDLIDTGDPFLAAVVTRGTQVVGVERSPANGTGVALSHLRGRGLRVGIGRETGKERLGPLPSPHCRAEAQSCR